MAAQLIKTRRVGHLNGQLWQYKSRSFDWNPSEFYIDVSIVIFLNTIRSHPAEADFQGDAYIDLIN